MDWLQEVQVDRKMRAAPWKFHNKGHDTRAIPGWLGHRSITSAAVYTALAPNRIKDFWGDYRWEAAQAARFGLAINRRPCQSWYELRSSKL
jgi:hypothetical protein